MIGPLLDGMGAPPENLGPFTEEIEVDHDEVWRRTLTYWPSAVIPPYGLSEGWLWVWEMDGRDRLWHMVTVY